MEFIEDNILGTALEAIHSEGLQFTGEQYTPGAGVEIAYEHIHRYLFAASFLDPQSVVLDLGCGSGYGTLFLASKVKHVYALDQDGRCLDVLKDVALKLAIENITIIHGDIEQFIEKTFSEIRDLSAIICHEFIEHISENTQKELLKFISHTKDICRKDVKLFISTPDKSLYRQGETENAYHLHELTEREFYFLLKRSFQNVQMYRQMNATANCLVPVANENNHSTKVSHIEFLDWRDSIQLLPTVVSHPGTLGQYLYAVASNVNEVLPNGSSVLIDGTERLIGERLARHEVSLLERGRQEGEQIESQKMRETISQIEHTVQIQAAKISELLATCETLGNNLSNLKAQHFEALQWKNMGVARLGPTFEIANHQIDVLRSYVDAMGSPGHRFVSFIGKRIGRGIIGRGLRRIIQIFILFRKVSAMP